MYLEQINGPQDVKKLSVEQLNTLADEMRAALLNRLSKHGGHFGPNFGMVEATIALHYVFESPTPTKQRVPHYLFLDFVVKYHCTSTIFIVEAAVSVYPSTEFR